MLSRIGSGGVAVNAIGVRPYFPLFVLHRDAVGKRQLC